MKYYDELQRRTVCHQILVKPWGKRGNGSFCPLTDYTLSCRPGWFISYCTTYISITNWFFESQICHLKYTWNLIWNLEVWYMPKFCDTVAGWFIVQDSLLLVFGDLEDYTTNIDYFYFHIAGGNLYFSPLTDCTSAVCTPTSMCQFYNIFMERFNF